MHNPSQPMRPTPRPLAGPALLAYYGVKLIGELANENALGKEMAAVARANKLGPVQSFFLTHAREAWDGEVERLMILGVCGYAEISLPSLRIARVGTLFTAQAAPQFLQGVGRARRASRHGVGDAA